MPSLEVPDWGILRDGSPIHLKPRRPEALREAHIGPIFLLPAINRIRPHIPRILATFCCLAPFWGPTSPPSSSWTGLFFFRSRIAFNPRSVGSKGRGGGSVGGTWDLVASFEVDTLFWAAMRPLSSCCPCSMRSDLPLLQRSCLGGQSPKWGHEH